MTPRVKKILGWYGAENVGTLSNLARILNHGQLGDREACDPAGRSGL
jgi:fructose-bisphosphate aldolase, class I